MDPSTALLNRYLADQSETAFRELVQRHVNLVYGTARRRCGGDEALARDVSQAVFTDLARKASSLPQDVMLAGWLHRHTGCVASKLIRSEQRRRQREHTAFMENQLNPQSAAAESGALWQRMAPVLDAALSRLSSADRDALVLRFLEGREFREVGGALGLSENTARMRVTRALEKLRRVLERRGITSTGTGLGAALGLAVGTQLPVGLGTWLSTTALQAGPAATGWATVSSLLAGWGKAVATVAAVALVSVPLGMLMASHGSGSGKSQDFPADDLPASRTPGTRRKVQIVGAGNVFTPSGAGQPTAAGVEPPQAPAVVELPAVEVDPASANPAEVHIGV